MVATLRRQVAGRTGSFLSVPFSSGQWLLQVQAALMFEIDITFSPLFVGAMVATTRSAFACNNLNRFQSPFSSGQWLLPGKPTPATV